MKNKTEKKTSRGVKNEKLLTELELEIMNLVWSFESCTVKDVQNALPKERPLAYTSVATMMKILEEKGFLKSERLDKAHTYRPCVARSDYEGKSLKHLAEKVFQGSPSSMVMRLLEESEISKTELESIRALLNERLNP